MAAVAAAVVAKKMISDLTVPGVFTEVAEVDAEPDSTLVEVQSEAHSAVLPEFTSVPPTQFREFFLVELMQPAEPEETAWMLASCILQAEAAEVECQQMPQLDLPAVMADFPPEEEVAEVPQVWRRVGEPAVVERMVAS